MKTSEKIAQEIDGLPPTLQEEVLDFVGYLKSKLTAPDRAENTSWTELSLQNALRGMENDTFPEYQAADFKEKWR